MKVRQTRERSDSWLEDCARHSQNSRHAHEISIISSVKPLVAPQDATPAVPSTDTDDDDDDRISITGVSSKECTYSVNSASWHSFLLAVLVGFIGAIASLTFVGFGLAAVSNEQQKSFEHLIQELVLQVEATWDDYETASLWLHQACSRQNISRHQFEDLYTYMTSSSLEVNSINWVPRVLQDERAALEAETRAYYAAEHPDIQIVGIQELVADPLIPYHFKLVKRSEQTVYYPSHYIEPIHAANSLWIDFDVYSIEDVDNVTIEDDENVTKKIIDKALETWQPTVSNPFWIPGSLSISDQNSVLLINPGIPLPHHPEVVPQDLAMIVIEMQAIMARTISGFKYESVAVYLYDSSARNPIPNFLIGVDLSMHEGVYFLPAVQLADLVGSTETLMESVEIPIASTNWTVVAVALEGEFAENRTVVIVAGVFIFVACLFVAFWIWWDMKRIRKMQSIRFKANADRAAVVLQSTQEHARAEQELNDYIAHEIRNPLAAAMSACSFVKSAVHEKPPLPDEGTETCVREDVDIIDESLTFMNDLLRSMLDMHKAASNRIELVLVPVNIERDILQPVAAMLQRRDSNFEVLVECPDNLVAKTDSLRLKQIVLNLGRNSAKFVGKGYIKLGAAVVHGTVQLYVSDSGPGIPEARQHQLFARFQKSLDIMEQGTGMGPCLCKNMTKLLEGEIWLDRSFESGVPRRPGTRFIVDLKIPPMSFDECEELLLVNQADAMDDSIRDLDDEDTGGVDEEERSAHSQELPKTLSVLFVDDDMVLRKLFSRSVKKVADTWKIQQAANGETALQMAAVDNFDLIFMDQYMASAEKTMLGTETTQELRAMGIKSRICGLSANDVEQGFLGAGADFFLQKPFPCKPDDLKRELLRVVCSKRKSSGFQATRVLSASTIVTSPLTGSEASTASNRIRRLSMT